jgi:hypothetical protein
MEATTKSEVRKHYTQKFDNGLQDIVVGNTVSIQEAVELVKSFYAESFSNGKVFLMGFSKVGDDTNLIEFSKGDKGAVELIRVSKTKTGGELFEEHKTALDDAVMCLHENW